MRCPRCGSEDVIATERPNEFLCMECHANIKPKRPQGSAVNASRQAPVEDGKSSDGKPKELAHVSIVLAVIALLVSWIQFGSVFGAVFSVIALSIAYISSVRIKRGEADGKNQTLASLIIGAIALTISVIVTVCSAMNYMSMYNSYKGVVE